MSKTVDAGIVTAYGAAVRGGYEGTYAQFCADLGKLADVLSEFMNFDVTVQTLAEGASATASYNDGVLALGIPRGNTGNGIQSIMLNADYTLTVTYTNGNTWTSGSIRGQVGATPHLTIGTVQTLEPGQSATAEITGTDEDPVLNLGIPKGQAGASDAGGISYDPESSYNEGTVGAELQEQNRHLSDLEDTVSTTQIINSASGAIASFDDGADGQPIRKLVANIEPVQDLHGYDNPWPAGGGKNKFPYADWFTEYNASTNNLLVGNDTIFLPSGTYRLSFEYYIDGAPSWSCFWRIYSEHLTACDGTKQLEYLSLSLSEVSTWTSKTVNVNITQDGWFGIDNGQLRGGVRFRNIQLEAGTSATSFAPYSNICPISGHTGAEIEQKGKNLLNPSNFHLNKSYDDSTSIGRSVAIIKMPHGEYTVSRRDVSLFREITVARCKKPYPLTDLYSGGLNSTVNLITNSSATITINDEYPYVYIICIVNNGEITIENIESSGMQLELGSTATTYHPYIGNQISVNWEDEAGTVYGGTVDPISGKLTDEMIKYAFSAFAWRTNGSGLFFSYLTNQFMLPDTIDGCTIICNKYEAVPYGDRNESKSQIYTTWNGAAAGQLIYVTDGRFTTVNDFLADNADTYVFAKRVESLEYSIASQQLTTLYGTNNIWASTGDTEVEYPCDTKLYIDRKITQAIANALNS